MSMPHVPPFQFAEDTFFEVTLEAPGVNMNGSGLTEAEARDRLDRFERAMQGDEECEEMIASVRKSFGFCSSYHGPRAVGILAKRPRIDTGERQTCPRRMKDWGPWDRKAGLDHWERVGDDRVCSFCGSLHPDEMPTRMLADGLDAIDPSTKQYKWYLKKGARNASLGAIKYYRYHDTPELLAELKRLLDAEAAKEPSDQ